MDEARWLLTIFGIGGILVGIPMGMFIWKMLWLLKHGHIMRCKHCGWCQLEIFDSRVAGPEQPRRVSVRDADGNAPSTEFEQSLPLDIRPEPMLGETAAEQRERQMRLHREALKKEPPPGEFDQDPPNIHL